MNSIQIRIVDAGGDLARRTMEGSSERSALAGEGDGKVRAILGWMVLTADSSAGGGNGHTARTRKFRGME
jgi:hypothetical protein